MTITRFVCPLLMGLLLLSGCRDSPTSDTPNTTGAESPSSVEPTTTEAPDSKPTAEPDGSDQSSAATEPGKRIAVGDKAPSFQMKDQHGQEHSLSDMLAKGNVALVFYRSADW